MGINSRLDSLQASILNVKMPHLDRWTVQRQENANRYTRLCSATPISIGFLACPRPGPMIGTCGTSTSSACRRGGATSCVSGWPRPRSARRFTIRWDCYQQACYRNLGYTSHDLPETETCRPGSAGVANLPRTHGRGTATGRRTDCGVLRPARPRDRRTEVPPADRHPPQRERLAETTFQRGTTARQAFQPDVRGYLKRWNSSRETARDIDGRGDGEDPQEDQ